MAINSGASLLENRVQTPLLLRLYRLHVLQYLNPTPPTKLELLVEILNLL